MKLGLNGSTFEVIKIDVKSCIGYTYKYNDSFINQDIVNYNDKKCIIRKVKDYTYILQLISCNPEDYILKLE